MEKFEGPEYSALGSGEDLNAVESGQLKDACNPKPSREQIYVDVIIPVHNAGGTVKDAVRSAMNQVIPRHLLAPRPSGDGGSSQAPVRMNEVDLDVAVCCFDDGSSDESWSILCQLKAAYENSSRSADLDSDVSDEKVVRIPTKLFIGSSKDGVARGAGYARNQAVSLRSAPSSATSDLYFLCLLDSDDIMHCTRVAEQLNAMIAIPSEERSRTILGCNFDRDPPDSTWHYSHWANSLSDERLMLERYREVTVLQPTWFLLKSRFVGLGGYIQAPHPHEAQSSDSTEQVLRLLKRESFQLIHPTCDTPQSLKLAEDLRLFHAHLYSNGLLRLHRTSTPLVTYRHRVGMSQSSQTPRKLLLQLRVLAFERAVLRSDSQWLKHGGSFVVWGAGRDGKDFVKALSEDLRHRVAYFVDVDYKKISAGYYVNKDLGVKIPIVHFSMLASDPDTRKKLLVAWEEECQDDNAPQLGRIDKSKKTSVTETTSLHATRNTSKQTDPYRKDKQLKRATKRRKLQPAGAPDLTVLPKLPIVVCVALYRTNGALERNVCSIGRTEGKDLWHFS